MPSTLLPLGQLLSDAWKLYRKHMRSILMGAALFGTAVAIMGAVANRRIEGHIWSGMQRLGFSEEQMMDMRRTLQSGDADAVEKTVQDMGRMTEMMERMTDEDREAFFAREGMAMMMSVLPVVGFGAFVWLIISLCSTTYFLLLFLGKAQEPIDLLQMGLHRVLPLLGVWVWSFLRSFAWIPVVGLIPAVVLGPRFLLAPVFVADKRTGICASVEQSHVATRGHWHKIVGNTFCVGVLVWVISWVLNSLLMPVAMSSIVLGIWVHAFVQQLTMAYGAAFLVLLTRTIMANPRST
jgi:hypothetical protein